MSNYGMLFMPKPKKARILFDKEILDFYKNDGIVMGFREEMAKRLGDYERRIQDNNIKKHISYLYKCLEGCTGKLNCVNLEKAVEYFEKHLQTQTGQKYDITLVVNGNL